MKIEKYLVLNKYLLSFFGISDFRELQEKLKNVQVGVDIDGRSYFINILRSSFENLKISEDALLRYDENIQSYVRKINHRREFVSLKYFQYLAVLFTEIFLDKLKNGKLEFLHELNEFLEKYKQEQEINFINIFSEEDLRKLAFWMATGSGKTLIMHINYHQFLNYKLFSPDNIILITPNEGLSKQHFEELQKSNIPAKVYEGRLNNELSYENEVLVIEMTKFVEEKKGGGVTLPVEVFEGRNLIFVDEGHKGKTADEQKWARLRNKLAENGFVFEYSATFGQILSESQPEILKEYSKSIIFDYSYKYFYLDGYGKDFSVLNISNSNIDESNFKETMFVANLLSFYEQVLVYEENIHLAKEYNLEKPLWIFVGTTVTGNKEESDVIQIVEFIKKIMKNEKWTREQIEKVFYGNTGLTDENNEDIFKRRFGYLKSRNINFNDIYKKIFGGKGEFRIYELKNAEGEFGLKVGENNYFGVINIGDTTGFKKQLENIGITVSLDAVCGSLFDSIKVENSPINILIGSKKFIEGWDTWRVSSMGLLNIGQGQGPQIIQLFGRGVRLKGKGMSLKRSNDKSIAQFLETINIYGIKANYLSKFLEAINKEEVEFETIEIPVKLQHEEKWKELYTLTKDDKKRFEEEKILRLEIDDTVNFSIDLLPKMSAYLVKERKEKGLKIEQIKTEVPEMRIPENIVDLFDWEKIWKEISDYKALKGYWNLILDRDILKKLILSDKYKILVMPEIMEVHTQNDVLRLEDIAILIIKKYIDLFYRKFAKRFETENMSYTTLDKQLTLFIFEKCNNEYSYTIQIDKRESDLIKEIKRFSNSLDRLIEDDNETLPRIYFNKHLYLPVLLQSKKIDKISPQGLVESEKQFILDLRNYLKNNQNKFTGIEIYLLRNYPKSGIGFFNLSGFYPDFIMWIKKDNKQIIVFIDPKGLEHTKGLDDEKIQLHKDIKELEKKLGDNNTILESYIISKTPYNKLIEGRTAPTSKDEYIKHHVLFLEDENCIDILFNHIL